MERFSTEKPKSGEEIVNADLSNALQRRLALGQRLEISNEEMTPFFDKIQSTKMARFNVQRSHPFGLHWKKIGLEKPGSGIEISNPELVKILEQKHDFSKEEYDALKMSNLSPESYLIVNNTYWKPAAELIEPTELSCDSYVKVRNNFCCESLNTYA